MGQLDGKVALITGGSMGLGRAIAEAYLAAGAHVLIMARHALPEPLDERIVDYEGDVIDWLDVKGAVDEALEEWGRIDILVNNAAVHGPIGPLASLDIVQWSKACAINLAGPALMMATVIPHLPAHGKIVSVAGGGATGPRPNFSAYAASKTALVRLTECVAAEYPHLDVNAMSPGAMTTRLTMEIYEAEQAGDEEKIAAAGLILSTSEKPETFTAPVALALWLAGAESDGITGRLFSAVWDNYQVVPSEAAQDGLEPDAFTLRRQVPDWARK